MRTDPAFPIFEFLEQLDVERETCLSLWRLNTAMREGIQPRTRGLSLAPRCSNSALQISMWRSKAEDETRNLIFTQAYRTSITLLSFALSILDHLCSPFSHGRTFYSSCTGR